MIQEIKELTHYALIGYLKSRYISMVISKKFIKEVHYQFKDKNTLPSVLKTILADGNYETNITRIAVLLKMLHMSKMGMTNLLFSKEFLICYPLLARKKLLYLNMISW